jgi:peroxiredoxin
MSQPETGPEVGQHAPDFTLPYSRTESANLSDYRGRKKVVLAFYVLDFTGG